MESTVAKNSRQAAELDIGEKQTAMSHEAFCRWLISEASMRETEMALMQVVQGWSEERYEELEGQTEAFNQAIEAAGAC
jgi:hypothetical protein